MTINKQTAKTLHDEALDALRAVAAKHGLTVSKRGGTIGATAILKFEFATIAGNGAVLTQEVADFRRCAHLFDLKPEDLGRTFEHGDGDRWEITGLSLSSRIYPICVRRVRDGKAMRFPMGSVTGGLAKEAK